MGNNVRKVADDRLEQMRQTVLGQELSARSYAAVLSQMQSVLEIHRIQADYDAVMKYNEDYVAGIKAIDENKDTPNEN